MAAKRFCFDVHFDDDELLSLLLRYFALHSQYLQELLKNFAANAITYNT
jgi:hypothetical protein